MSNGNAIHSFSATNSTSGDIALTNTAAPLALTGISNTSGSVAVSNTGGITTTGSVTGNYVTLQSTGTIALEASLTAAVRTILAPSSGGVSQLAGTVTSDRLLLSGSGTFSLPSTSLATLAAAILGSITLHDSSALTIDAVYSGSRITTGNGGTNGGDVTLSSDATITVNQGINTEGGAGGTQSIGDGVVINATLAVGAGDITLGGTELLSDLPKVNIDSPDSIGANVGPNSGVFLVTRDGDLSSALNVRFTVSGTAVQGTDYTLSTSNGVIVVAAGSAFATVAVSLPMGALTGDDIMVTLALDTDSAYVVGDADAATVELFDNSTNSEAAANRAPTAQDIDNLMLVHDHVLFVDESGGMLAHSSDPDNDPLQALVITPPSHGSISQQDGSSGADGFEYTPDVGYVGADTFTYKVTDGFADSNIATVTITATNNAPVGSSHSYATDEEQQLTGSVMESASDADGDPVQAQLASDVSNGTLVLHDDGSFIYTPAVNSYGSDSFTYVLTDGIATTGPFTAAITVREAYADLDAHDAITVGDWMPEAEEQTYGVFVDTENTAQITTRVEAHYPNPAVNHRELDWDPTVLSINGDTSGHLQLDRFGSGEVFTIQALHTGYDTTQILYEVDGIATTPNPHLTMDMVVLMQVVEKKAVVDSVEFTSDQRVIIENTQNILESGKPYEKVQWVRQMGYKAPITQTWDTPVKAEVKFRAGGLGNQVIVTGFAFDPALSFISGNINVGQGGAAGPTHHRPPTFFVAG